MDLSGDINFEKMFKIMIWAMKLNKSHPDIPRDKKWACQFLIMHGLFFLVFCFLLNSTIFYDIKRGDFTQACANGILITIFGVVTFKYCIMLRYQDLLKKLIEEMKVDYETAKSYCLIEQQIIHAYAKRGTTVVKLWLIIAVVCGSLFVVKNLIMLLYNLVKGDFQLIPLYDLTYPKLVEEMKNEPIVFFLLYIMFLLYDIYGVIMYIAMAALGPIFMLHSCGQLEIVRRRLLNIFNEQDSERKILEKLKGIVRHFQNIYSFLERVQESFRILYELTLKATVIILPISFYQVIQSYHDGDLRIEFIAIIVGGIALSSIPCYYSDQLMDMGENVRLSIYMCGWEGHLDKHKGLRTTLLFIHLRASRPVGIRTMFRTVSLDALTDVYHQAYAIFSVLNAASH